MRLLVNKSFEPIFLCLTWTTTQCKETTLEMIKDNYLITILADVFINKLSMENIQEKTKRMVFGVSFDTTEIHSLFSLLAWD